MPHRERGAGKVKVKGFLSRVAVKFPLTLNFVKYSWQRMRPDSSIASRFPVSIYFLLENSAGAKISSSDSAVIIKAGSSEEARTCSVFWADRAPNGLFSSRLWISSFPLSCQRLPLLQRTPSISTVPFPLSYQRVNSVFFPAKQDGRKR